MKKLLYVLALLFTLSFSFNSCKTEKLITDTEVVELGISQFNVYEKAFSGTQVDSILAADNLPPVTQWVKNSYRDPETGKAFTAFLFLQQLGRNQIIWRVEPAVDSDSLIVAKRVTK